LITGAVENEQGQTGAKSTFYNKNVPYLNSFKTSIAKIGKTYGCCFGYKRLGKIKKEK